MDRKEKGFLKKQLGISTFSFENSFSNDLDLAEASLSNIQLEELLILLINRAPMTKKEIERNLQYAYIFEYFNKIRDEYVSRLFNENKNKKSYGLGEFDKFIKDKKLDNFLEKFLILLNSEDKDDISEFLTTTDKENKLTPENKRIKLVFAINSVSQLKIPSFKTINKALEGLIFNYVDVNRSVRLRTTSNASLSINSNFYKLWSERRTSIIEEYESKLKERENSPITIERIKKERAPDYTYIRSETIKYISEKYGKRLLDFYLILPYDRTPESVYLKHSSKIKMYLS